ncbi:MAG TPA: hypothetical protein VFY93_14480 [Planctomycetota bacterium]|nr:hypothetical protein [Planctomycetota bacterium]
MRLVFLVLLLCALVATPLRAENCAWTVISNINPPDLQTNSGSGSALTSWWSWQYILSAKHLYIFGNMNAYAYRCTTNLSAAASGNGTYIVTRVIGCRKPIEDIEGIARNEFRAHASINDDSYAQAYGSQRIKASKMTLDCHASGGVEATAGGHGSGDSGSYTLQVYAGGPSVSIHWSKGGSMDQIFQDNDGGEGGRSPEVITCQTTLGLALSVGWWDDSGSARITDSKSELTVWGTCDGYCGVIVPVIEYTSGY